LPEGGKMENGKSRHFFGQLREFYKRKAVKSG
jgi:hypothetical protein